MDELLVRRLTAALFEVLPQLALSLDYLRLMDIERSPATPIPLTLPLPFRDGAVRRQAIDCLRQHLRQFLHELLDGQPGFRR